MLKLPTDIPAESCVRKSSFCELIAHGVSAKIKLMPFIHANLLRVACHNKNNWLIGIARDKKENINLKREYTILARVTRKAFCPE